MPDRQDVHEESDLHDVLRRDLETGASGTAPPPPEHPAEVPDGPAPDLDDLLGTTLPGPVPSTVITLAARSAHEVGRLLQKLPGQLDETVGQYPVKLELRLDMLPGFSERVNAAALVLKLGVPAVFTLRPRTEGGVSTQTEAERQQFLFTLLGALRQDVPRGSLLDIEGSAVAADPEGWGKLLGQARRRGFQVLLSHHDFRVSPDRAAKLLPPEDLLDDTPGGGALLWKSATRVRTWEQTLAILRALRRGNLARRRHAIMAIGTPVPRLLAPFFATPLVYAAPDDERAVAPGQVPFADLIRTWARWGVLPDDDGFRPRLDPGATPDADDRAASARAARESAPRLVLLGRPAWHSLSPAMHNAAARTLGLQHRYFPLGLPEHVGAGTEEELVRTTFDTLPALGVVGGNVTVPFKTAAARVADRLEGDAEALAAANTFHYDGDTLVASNTDPEGIRRAIDTAETDVSGAKVLVVGAGGTARAAAHALRDAGEVTVTNRTAERATTLVDALEGPLATTPWSERAAAAEAADIIIQTTTVGMEAGPDPLGDPLDGVAFRAGQTVLDMVYMPGDDPAEGTRTRLLRRAADAGADVVDGLVPLLHQGAVSFRTWTQETPDLDTMRAAMDAARRIPFPDTIDRVLAQEDVTA